MAYSQFTLVLAPVPLSNSVHTQYHVCVYTTCKGREMCMHKIQLVYTRVVLCVWPQNYLCMSTIASPPLQFCVYTIPILCVRSVKTARNVYAQNAICVRDVQFVYTRIIICVWPQTFLCTSTDFFVDRHRNSMKQPAGENGGAGVEIGV